MYTWNLYNAINQCDLKKKEEEMLYREKESSKMQGIHSLSLRDRGGNFLTLSCLFGKVTFVTSYPKSSFQIRSTILNRP